MTTSEEMFNRVFKLMQKHSHMFLQTDIKEYKINSILQLKCLLHEYQLYAYISRSRKYVISLEFLGENRENFGSYQLYPDYLFEIDFDVYESVRFIRIDFVDITWLCFDPMSECVKDDLETINAFFPIKDFCDCIDRDDYEYKNTQRANAYKRYVTISVMMCKAEHYTRKIFDKWDYEYLRLGLGLELKLC